MDRSRKPVGSSAWSDETPAGSLNGDESLNTDATVPIGAVSPVAHWTHASTNSDGTPFVLRPDAQPEPASTAHLEASRSEAPATLPMGSMSPAPRAPALASTRPALFTPVPDPPRAASSPAPRALSTALPPPRGAPLEAVTPPAHSPSPERRPSAVPLVGLLAVVLLVLVTLACAVLASHR